MADDVFSRLTYYGHCWPAAKAVERMLAINRYAPDDEGEEELVWKLELSGNGRAFQETRPNGWWRSFAELDVDDKAAVTNWMQRKGHPFKSLTPLKSTLLTTARWADVKKFLQPAVALYGKRDADGVARIEADAAACSAALADLLEITKKLIRFDPHVVSHEGKLELQPFALTLDAFLHGSAAHLIDKRLPLNVCLHCGDWFPVYRAGTKYCSTTCRAAASLAKGAA